MDTHRSGAEQSSNTTRALIERLSQTLGVPELRCGTQILRNQKGWRDDEIEVDYLWYALVMPSFHPRAAIGMAHMDESEFRGKKHPAVIRAAVVISDRGKDQVGSSTFAEVTEDPLVEAIRGVELLPENRSLCLDGICYELRTSGWEIDATLRIRNPQTATLRAIEQSLFQVVSTVQKQTGNDKIAAYLNSWQEYLKR